MELLIVIMIIATLAAMIIPRLISKTEDAKVAKAMGDLANLNTVLNTFRLDVGRYPSTEEGLEVLRTPPQSAQNWNGPYIERNIPLDPWGNPYQYGWPGAYGNDSFTLYSLGADGQDGGDGNNADIYQTD